MNIVQIFLSYRKGFFHEHQRHDRDSHIRFADIKACEQANSANYKKYSSGYTFFGQEYDYCSIMHYSASKYPNYGSACNMWPVDSRKHRCGVYGRYEIGQRNFLSDGDFAALQKRYGNLSGCKA